MAIVESGREAVWRHAKEAGIDKDIALIAKYFDIADVAIVFNGKFTYLNNRPMKTTKIKVGAMPSQSLSEHLKAARNNKTLKG